MIRVLMLDLGETLVHGTDPFLGVPESLEALMDFETADGSPLPICLVSDYHLAPAPATTETIDAIFQDFLRLLEKTQLTRYVHWTRERFFCASRAIKSSPAWRTRLARTAPFKYSRIGKSTLRQFPYYAVPPLVYYSLIP